ncbi:MAG: hypothetical protein AAB401_25395 [Acidobacteriota bacterium]
MSSSPPPMVQGVKQAMNYCADKSIGDGLKYVAVLNSALCTRRIWSKPSPLSANAASPTSKANKLALLGLLLRCYASPQSLLEQALDQLCKCRMRKLLDGE